MAAIGADPEALEDLAAALRAASGVIDDVVHRVDSALGRSGWSGPDAERFRRSWQSTHRRSLGVGSSRCRSLARRIDHQAGEQRRASFGTGAPSAGARLPELPDDLLVLDGAVTGSVGPLSATLAGTLAIDELGDRRRVTYTDAVRGGVGVTAGSGVRASWDGHVSGTGATGSATAAVDDRVTRTWTVEQSELTPLLFALAAEQNLVHSPSGLVSRSATQLVRLVNAVGAVVGLDVPDRSVGPAPFVPAPQRTEDLVGIAVGAAGWTTMLGSGVAVPGGGAAGTTSGLRVGVAEDSGARSLVLEADGAVAVSVLRSTPVLAATEHHLVDGASAVRIEVPLGAPRGRPVILTATGTDGDGADVVRVAVDPWLAPGAARAALQALERARHGDPAGAVAALAEVRVPDGALQLDASRIAVDGETAGIDMVGAAASIEFSGALEHHRRMP